MFPKLAITVIIKKKKSKIPSKQQGSALVVAIFIITVMTLLGSALVRMVSSNAETIAYEVIGTRAYQAAQAGAQRKLSELFPLKPNVGVCSPTPDPDPNNNEEVYDFSTDVIKIKGLENCRAIKVTCQEDATVDSISYYTVTSTGRCEVADVFTSRTIEIKARSL